METWAIVVIVAVVAGLIFAALAFGWVKRIRGGVPDVVDVDIEAAPPATPSNVKVDETDLDQSTVKGRRGAEVSVTKSRVRKSKISGQ